MPVLCVIPARGGSKGLHRKNIMPLAGNPLLAYPISAAKLSGVCDAVFVTTDDAEMASVARRYGADVPFLRPPELAEDLTTTESTLQHALLAYEEHTGRKFDICVFLTATDVFRRPAWVTEAVVKLRADPLLESVFSGHATHKNYWVQEDDGAPYHRVLPWMREYSSRQVRRAIYREDTGLTCASRADLWREGRRIGDVVDIIPNRRTETSLDIHDSFDLFLAEQAINWLRAHDPENAPQVTPPAA